MASYRRTDASALDMAGDLPFVPSPALKLPHPTSLLGNAKFGHGMDRVEDLPPTPWIRLVSHYLQSSPLMIRLPLLHGGPEGGAREDVRRPRRHAVWRLAVPFDNEEGHLSLQCSSAVSPL